MNRRALFGGALASVAGLIGGRRASANEGVAVIEAELVELEPDAAYLRGWQDCQAQAEAQDRRMVERISGRPVYLTITEVDGVQALQYWDATGQDPDARMPLGGPD